MFDCLDFIDISPDVLLYPGTLQDDDELPIKLAWQNDTIAESSAHRIPSTEGISNLYTPYLFVVLFTENAICSAVRGVSAFNLQSIRTSAPVCFPPIIYNKQTHSVRHDYQFFQSLFQ